MTVEIYDYTNSSWFDITPWIAWQGLTFSINEIDGPSAGRNMAGLMVRDRVGIKEKMNISTIQLTRAQMAKLQSLLSPVSFSVRVTPYPVTNAAAVFEMYTNNIQSTYVIHRSNGEDLQSVKFPLIEM